jgi:hypothetical protein
LSYREKRDRRGAFVSLQREIECCALRLLPLLKKKLDSVAFPNRREYYLDVKTDGNFAGNPIIH